MNLDDFKTAWETLSESDDLNQATNRMNMLQNIEQNSTDRLSRQTRRYKRMSLWLLTLPLIMFVLFYAMSDGFTNSQDSTGALMVNLVLLIPFLAFFGTRYFATKQIEDLKDVAVRHYLPKVVTSLESNQKAELVVLTIVIVLTIIGLVLSLVFETAVSPWLIGVTSILIIGLGFKAWRGYEGHKAEINAYINQLNENI